MSLKCGVCGNEVPEGFSQCLVCRSGFASQLKCGACGSPIERGKSSCDVCARQAREASLARISQPPPPPIYGGELIPTGMPPRASQLATLPSMGLPGVIQVPEQYNSGKLGVSAVVSIPKDHVDVMNDLGKMVPLLHQMASRLIALPGDGARQLAKSMRMLATDIQGEIEARIGQ